jgi:hypothetical protein
MSKVWMVFAFFMLRICLCPGQSFYIKAGGGYSVPIIKQTSPDYFSIESLDPLITHNINFINRHFSVADGFRIQGVIGYELNNFVSLELGVSYFANTKKEFEGYPIFADHGKTSWNYKNYSFVPALIIGQTFNKSSINIRFFTGVGFSDLNISALASNIFLNKYSFDKSISYSYGYGIEYSYKLSSKIHLYAGLGINNTFFSPKHAELVSSAFSLENLSVHQKEIDYVKEINDLYVEDINKPETRIQETLKLNSLYFEIGLKYTLKKNEKN